MAVSDLFFIVETSIQNGMRKPHPTIFYDTLLKLGTDACSCIYIGNNYTDD
jgi:FMN phosphatase YigB (HAD superfamily)